MSFNFQKLLVLMTTILPKTAATSACKISQPYILLGPLGRTMVPGKKAGGDSEFVHVCSFCVCACVFRVTMVCLRNGLYSESTKDLALKVVV